MLPEFYQNHLKSQLSLAEYIFLKIFINLLQSIKKVNLEKLANALPLPIKFES
ncbi:MAG: IS4 family transposase, partial [Moorea sp. SIO4G3]|nr:IS4 family transposase [Moorena sp. SIO4G3]